MVVIKVDTRKDSKEDIKKAISFLEKFLDSGESYDGLNPGAMSIFSQDDATDNDDNEEITEEEKEDVEIKPMFY